MQARRFRTLGLALLMGGAIVAPATGADRAAAEPAPKKAPCTGGAVCVFSGANYTRDVAVVVNAPTRTCEATPLDAVRSVVNGSSHRLRLYKDAECRVPAGSVGPAKGLSNTYFRSWKR